MTEYQMEQFCRTLLDVMKKNLREKEKSASSDQEQSTQSFISERSHSNTKERKSL